MTVKELRESITMAIEPTARKEVTSKLERLIAAAEAQGFEKGRAEGFAEGVEDTTADLALVEDAEAFARGYQEGEERERERILKPIVDRHWNSKVEELREDIVGDLAQLAFLGRKHPEMTWGELRHKYGIPAVDSLIAACLVQGRQEGAWAEIAFLQHHTRNDIGVGRYLPYDNFLHPQELDASVISPAPIQKMRGKPSQALLDELSEICGDKVVCEPVSLDPKEPK